jgi:hypothetical protein
MFIVSRSVLKSAKCDAIAFKGDMPKKHYPLFFSTENSIFKDEFHKTSLEARIQD